MGQVQVHVRHGLRCSHVGERLQRGRFATVNIGIDTGHFSTLLQDPEKRPLFPRERHRAWFDLDCGFAMNLAQPGGLSDTSFGECGTRAGQGFSRAVVPDEIVDVVRLGRFTALQKSSVGCSHYPNNWPWQWSALPVRLHFSVCRRVHRTRIPDFD